MSARKEMVGISRGKEEAERRICEALTSAIGPSGKSVLSSTKGVLSITKDGIEILDALFSNSLPAQVDLVYNSALKFGAQYGDGVKTFVLLIVSIMDSSTSVSPQRFTLQMNKLSKALDSIAPNMTCPQPHQLIKLVPPFFNVKFPSPVSTLMIELFTTWVQKNNLNIEYLLKNIDALCVTKMAAGPFHTSSVQRGITFFAQIYGKIPLATVPCHIFVFESVEEEEDIDLDQFKDIDPARRLVLVTLKPVEGRNLLELFLKGVIVIQPTDEDVFTFISNNYLDFRSTEVSFERTNHKTYVKFHIEVFQFVITSPTEQLKRTYVKSIENCLKVLLLCLKSKSHLIACGVFERSLAKALHKRFFDWDLIPVKSREELIGWEAASDGELLATCHDAATCNVNALMDHLTAEIEQMIDFDADVGKGLVYGLMDVARWLKGDNRGVESFSLKLALLQHVLRVCITYKSVERMMRAK